MPKRPIVVCLFCRVCENVTFCNEKDLAGLALCATVGIKRCLCNAPSWQLMPRLHMFSPAGGVCQQQFKRPVLSGCLV